MNEEMEKMKVFTQEEALDLTLGKKGTPEHDAYDAKVEDYLVWSCYSQGKRIKEPHSGAPLGTHRCSKSKNMQY